MTKRVSNRKGSASKLPFEKRPGRSKKTWLRCLAKRKWARRQEDILQRGIARAEGI